MEETIWLTYFFDIANMSESESHVPAVDNL